MLVMFFALQMHSLKSEMYSFKIIFHTVCFPQFEFSVYENGFIREMMKTPTVTCKKDAPDNGSNVLRTSCILSPSEILLLLFWFTAM